MRSLALAAVASLPLLGGCIAHPCDAPTEVIHWQLQNYDASSRGCLAASGSLDPDIAYVDVYIGSGTSRPLSYNCTDGAAYLDMSAYAPGSYPVTVEGVDAGGTIYYRDQFNILVGQCGGGTDLAVLREGLLNIDYHFGAPGTAADLCYGSGTGYIWFDLWDEVANQAISSITTLTSTAAPSWRDRYACGDLVEFPVPFGTYTLRGIQEVVAPLTTAPLSVAESCSPTSATVDRLGSATVTYLTPPDLVPPAAGAAACYPGAAP
jgi:hypothetical protein